MKRRPFFVPFPQSIEIHYLNEADESEKWMVEMETEKLITVKSGTPEQLDNYVTGVAVCDTGTFSVRNGSVYRLEGSKWRKIQSLRKPVVSLNAIGNKLYAGGKDSVWVSGDGGETWTLLGSF